MGECAQQPAAGAAHRHVMADLENANAITPAPGMIVSFDDPWDEYGARFVAAFIPGGITADGELLDLAWTDSYGGSWKWSDIEANNPAVHTPNHEEASHV